MYIHVILHKIRYSLLAEGRLIFIYIYLSKITKVVLSTVGDTVTTVSMYTVNQDQTAQNEQDVVVTCNHFQYLSKNFFPRSAISTRPLIS